MSMNGLKFMQSVASISEKAAEIARAVRAAHWTVGAASTYGSGGQSNSFLQTESKSDEDVTDFKTLADVLIQAVIIREIQNKLEGVASTNIHGEENTSFDGGTNGCSVQVEIKESPDETSQMLRRSLQDENLVSRLTSLIHNDENNLSDESISKLFSDKEQALNSINIDLKQIGVWIDPIDATNEYVKAKVPEYDAGVFCKGLSCVTVLIGFYDLSNGEPIAGVINRPFNLVSEDDRAHWRLPARWSSEIFWSLSPPDSSVSLSNLPTTAVSRADSNKLTITASAGERMWSVMTNPNYVLKMPRGAGNKVLAVAVGYADLYLITTDSNIVYRWDVCAGHAVLKSTGGGILSFKPAYEHFKLCQGEVGRINLTAHHIDYRGSNEALSDGIVCYRNIECVIRLFRDLMNSECG